MKKTNTRQIGQILIDKELISSQQLEKALQMQMEEGGLIGQILIKLSFVTAEQIEDSIYEQTHAAQKLENILLEIGMINQEQLDAAVEANKTKEGSLSSCIIDLGFITEEDLVSTMVMQYGFPYLQLENYDIDADVLKLVPKELALKYCVIPIDKIGNIITIAMADPLNLSVKDEIAKLTNLNVETFISTFSDISKSIGKCYLDADSDEDSKS